MKELYTEPSLELVKILGNADVITLSGEDWTEDFENDPMGPGQG